VRPIAFISSTVKDFAEVRRRLAAALEGRGWEVLTSETPSFPVAPGVTSHDACLWAVRRAHVFILLVGNRWGGGYLKQNKSITWREWEEAIQIGLSPITLVLRETNLIAQQIAKRRDELRAKRPTLRCSELDDLLREEFPDRPPHVSNLPKIQRFIDAIRKGHVDNWFSEWDGSVDHALTFVLQRIDTMFIDYQAQVREGRARYETLGALKLVAQSAAVLTTEVVKGVLNADDATQKLLELVSTKNFELFSYGRRDRHNLVLHRLVGDTLVPGPRVTHPEIPPRNRRWKLGQSHVSLAIQKNALMVSGDIRETDAWVHDPETDESDRRNYVSAITVPLYLRGEPQHPDATFTLTSSRLDQFRDLEQPEVLTAQVVGSILNSLWSLGVRDEPQAASAHEGDAGFSGKGGTGAARVRGSRSRSRR
jgi:hypothetical protein